jgi:hypothetical protein
MDGKKGSPPMSHELTRKKQLHRNPGLGMCGERMSRSANWSDWHSIDLSGPEDPDIEFDCLDTVTMHPDNNDGHMPRVKGGV